MALELRTKVEKTKEGRVGGEGGVGSLFVVSTKSHKKGHCKNDKKQWILHIPRYSCICVTCYLHKAEKTSINCGQSDGKLIPPVWFCPHPLAV